MSLLPDSNRATSYTRLGSFRVTGIVYFSYSRNARVRERDSEPEHEIGELSETRGYSRVAYLKVSILVSLVKMFVQNTKK